MNRHRTPFVKSAWALIIVLTAGIAYLQTLSGAPIEGTDETATASVEDPAGLVMARIQAEIMLGILPDDLKEGEVAELTQAINIGTVTQRQSFIAFMIALGETKEAEETSRSLQESLLKDGLTLTDSQSAVQEQLDILIHGGSLPEDRESLETSLGWFGKLLEANPTERAAMEQKTKEKGSTLGKVAGVLFTLFALGCIGLIIAVVFAFSGKLQSGLQSQQVQHGMYAEVFAVWLFGFVVLMQISSIVAELVSSGSLVVGMLCSLVAFFLSVVCLYWARIRGVSWNQLKDDIGWTKGEGVLKEILFGIAGYAMTLPILGVGVLLTLLLIFIQTYFAGGSESFGGSSSGAHPIILQIAEGGTLIRVLVLLLAAVAAPIVEETFFRGVLYRQLRSWSERWGNAISILMSVALVSFIFAAIHPQGWVAIPALMGIAVGMNLMREWRGSLLPSMLVHGISNGIVTSVLFLLLS